MTSHQCRLDRSTMPRENRARCALALGVAAAISTLGASAHATPYTATFASWSSAVGGSAAGSLGSTGFTVTGVDLALSSWDMSNPSLFAAPGTATTPSLDFNQGNVLDDPGFVTTITFTNAVSDLALYALFWRAQTYSLVAKDASNNDVSYSFLSGSLTPAISGNSFTASNWLSGIIQFSGAVQTITFSTNLSPGGNAVMSLATLQATVIPGGGAIAMLGAAGVGGRRRRRR